MVEYSIKDLWAVRLHSRYFYINLLQYIDFLDIL